MVAFYGKREKREVHQTALQHGPKFLFHGKAGLDPWREESHRTKSVVRDDCCLRCEILNMLNEKAATTSYANFYDEKFKRLLAKSMQATGSNSEATEAIWTTLTGINLTLYPGEKLAVVGLNGVGKTTLVKLICGFFDPTEGSVLFDGKDIRSYNRRDYYAMFSAVFQDFSLLAGTIATNVSQELEVGIPIAIWTWIGSSGLPSFIQK